MPGPPFFLWGKFNPPPHSKVLMGWYEHMKRYVWDDERTPYLVKVPKLSRFQANKELLAYGIFLGTVFSVVTLIFFGRFKGGGGEFYLLFSAYGFAVTIAAYLLVQGKRVRTARFLHSVPFAIMAFVSLDGIQPPLPWVEKSFLLTVSILWVIYSFRVVAICRAYPGMGNLSGRPGS